MRWKRIATTALFALLSMALCTCAGPRMTAATGAETATCRVYITMHFDATLARELATQVGVTLKDDVSVPVIGVVAGYYNPFVDHITMDQKKITNMLVVHEYLHRVWFMDLTEAERRAFLRDLATVMDDPHEKVFADFEQKQLGGRHWLNKVFAWDTEAYSDIGELFINPSPPVTVPDVLRSHYARVLVPPSPKEPDTPPPLETVACGTP